MFHFDQLLFPYQTQNPVRQIQLAADIREFGFEARFLLRVEREFLRLPRPMIHDIGQKQDAHASTRAKSGL